MKTSQSSIFACRKAALISMEIILHTSFADRATIIWKLSFDAMGLSDFSLISSWNYLDTNLALHRVFCPSCFFSFLVISHLLPMILYLPPYQFLQKFHNPLNSPIPFSLLLLLLAFYPLKREALPQTLILCQNILYFQPHIMCANGILFFFNHFIFIISLTTVLNTTLPLSAKYRIDRRPTV